MPENERLIELVAQLLDEMRQMKEAQRETNKRLENIDERLRRLEEQQAKTNLLLQQHSRDLMKIAQSLDERVVHWGDKLRINGERGITGVVSKLE